MTYNEATKALKLNKSLFGTHYKKDLISEIIIVPRVDGALVSAVSILMSGHSLDSFNKNFSEFDLIALLNFDDYPNDGFLMWRHANQIQGYQHPQ